MPWSSRFARSRSCAAKSRFVPPTSCRTTARSSTTSASWNRRKRRQRRMGTNVRGDLVAPLEDQTLRRIAETGVVRAFPRNTVLINEGDVGDSLYVVLSGRVKVYSSNESGREFVIDFHGPGEYVGEMSLDGAPRSASVMTVEPTTCAVVNRAQFRDFVL